MEIQVFRNKDFRAIEPETKATGSNSVIANYSYSGLIPNERALNRERIISLFESCTDLGTNP